VAYIQNLEDDEQQQQQQQTTGGSSGGAFAGGMGGGGVGASGKGTGGTQPFVNIQSYLAANKPTDFGKVIGDKVTNPINEEWSRVQADVASKQPQIQSQLDANNYDPNQLMKDFTSKLGGYATQGGDILQNQQVAGPYNQIQGYLNASYNPVTASPYEQSQQVKDVAPFVANPDKFGSFSGAAQSPEILKQLYSQGGAPLTTGQFELQKQLDLPAADSFNQAKTGALDAYKGLQDALSSRDALTAKNQEAQSQIEGKKSQLKGSAESSLSQAQSDLDMLSPLPKAGYGKYNPLSYGAQGSNEYNKALSAINRMYALQKLLGIDPGQNLTDIAVPGMQQMPTGSTRKPGVLRSTI